MWRELQRLILLFNLVLTCCSFSYESAFDDVSMKNRCCHGFYVTWQTRVPRDIRQLICFVFLILKEGNYEKKIVFCVREMKSDNDLLFEGGSSAFVGYDFERRYL